VIEPVDRSYRQFCGVAHALDLVGERWALLVVRELLLGPRRFTDLQGGLPGVSTNVLATRLRRLERAGVLERKVLPPPAASSVYELTGYGRALEPIVLALGRWGARTMGSREPGQALASRWLALALKAFFHPEAAGEEPRRYELRLSEGAFVLEVADGGVDVRHAGGGEPDLVVAVDDDLLVRLLVGAVGVDDTLAAGGLEILAGDRAELDRFVEAFRFAEPISV
jgi:DNA-binding HxlR family transcriptional regulator